MATQAIDTAMLTLALSIERLPATVKPLNAGSDAAVTAALKNRINRVCERFLTKGKYAGAVEVDAIAIYGTDDTDYYFTLPRHLKSLEAGGMAGAFTRPIQSQWYQFVSGGYPVRPVGTRHYGPAQDLGTGYCLFRDIETASAITVNSVENEEVGTYLYIRAKDADGNKIYTTVEGEVIEGIRMDLAGFAPQTTAYTISEIYGLTKDVTKGVVTVSAGSDDLAYLEPGERIANYRRYLSGGYDATSFTHFYGIFNRQHVWAEADNDVLPVHSIMALESGLQAINYEEQGYPEKAAPYWGEAFVRLNDDLRQYNGGVEKHARLNPVTAGGSIPRLR